MFDWKSLSFEFALKKTNWFLRNLRCRIKSDLLVTTSSLMYKFAQFSFQLTNYKSLFFITSFSFLYFTLLFQRKGLNHFPCFVMNVFSTIPYVPSSCILVNSNAWPWFSFQKYNPIFNIDWLDVKWIWINSLHHLLFTSYVCRVHRKPLYFDWHYTK